MNHPIDVIIQCHPSLRVCSVKAPHHRKGGSREDNRCAPLTCFLQCQVSQARFFKPRQFCIIISQILHPKITKYLFMCPFRVRTIQGYAQQSDQGHYNHKPQWKHFTLQGCVTFFHKYCFPNCTESIWPIPGLDQPIHYYSHHTNSLLLTRKHKYKQ